MEIKGPASIRNAAELLLNAASQTADGRLLPGRVLSLALVSINEQQLVLRLNEQLISARLQLAPNTTAPTQAARDALQALQGLLQPGMQLRAEVVKGPQGQVALRLVAPPVPDAQAAVLAQLRPALRQSLPQQQSPAPLLANLQAVAQADSPLAPLLPPRLQQQVRDFIARLPGVEQVRSAEGLREAIRNTGLFTEHNLLAASPGGSVAGSSAGSTVRNDIRLGLLGIAAFLRQVMDKPAGGEKATAAPLPPSYSAPPGRVATSSPVSTADTSADATTASKPVPPAVQTPTPQPRAMPSLVPGMPLNEARAELLQQVEATLARIQSQHLGSQAMQAESTRPAFVFDLPLRTAQGIDVFQMRIQQEARGEDNDGAAAPWSVSLAFELESLGPVRALVSLLQGQVSVSFWAESPDTARLFNDHFDSLHTQLDAAGLRVGRLQSRTGQPGADEFHATRPPGLVDETA